MSRTRKEAVYAGGIASTYRRETGSDVLVAPARVFGSKTAFVPHELGPELPRIVKVLVGCHLPGRIDENCAARGEPFHRKRYRHPAERMSNGDINAARQGLHQIVAPSLRRILASRAKAVAAKVRRQHAITAFNKNWADAAPRAMVRQQAVHEHSRSLTIAGLGQVQLHFQARPPRETTVLPGRTPIVGLTTTS